MPSDYSNYHRIVLHEADYGDETFTLYSNPPIPEVVLIVEKAGYAPYRTEIPEDEFRAMAAAFIRFMDQRLADQAEIDRTEARG